MYRNAVYDQDHECVRLFTWDENGKRIVTTNTCEPYLYLETKLDEDATSIFNTKLKKKTFQRQSYRSRFIKDYASERVFYNLNPVQQFLVDSFWDVYDTPEFSKFPLKIYYIDIETYSPDAFPIPEEAKDTINVITIYNSINNMFYTWGLNPYTPKQENVKYYHCKSEVELLKKFISFLRKDYPDIISGWNSEGFDIPYIVNRVKKILEPEEYDNLSPLGNVYSRESVSAMATHKTVLKYYLQGIACIDYLDIYKKFSVGLRESYKLDYIAEYELGERKIDYGNTNLSSLADDDWETFIDYNIQDVNLLVRMEDKLRYLELLRMLSYVGLTTLEAAMGTLSVLTGAIAIKGKEKDLVIPTFTKDKNVEKYEGAYVGEPQRGFQENIISFDANSLYPNTMISLNLSPETKVGKIVEKTDKAISIKHVSGKLYTLSHEKFAEFVDNEKIAISRAKVLFTQAKKGLVPEIVDKLYQQRVEVKKEHKKYKLKLSKLKPDHDEYKQLKLLADRLDIKQFTIKILINTMYGYFGNKYAPMGDPDIARSITLTGQAVIKKSNDILREYIYERSGNTDLDPIVYNDTDSSYITIKPLTDSLGIDLVVDGKVNEKIYDEVQKVEDYLNKGITEWSRRSLGSADPRFVFKRECICDVGVFLQKKRYVLHVLDDEGIPVNKFKYTGVEVVRSTMPDSIKPYVKKIIETMLSTKSYSQTNEVFMEAYDTFKKLTIEDIAFVSGITNYDKYADKCNELNTVKSMPIHVKGAYYYNYLLDRLGIDSKYEKIGSGDKVRYFYTSLPNKYGLATIGYKYYFPDEFRSIFQPDTEKMFEKIIFSVIERFYDCVKWSIKRPSQQTQTDLFDLLGI